MPPAPHGSTASLLQARPIPVPPAPAPASAQTTLIVLTVAVVALYFGRDLLVPLALAVLLAFVLTPVVSRLQRLRLGRIPSVLLAVVVVFAAIGGFAVVVGSQVADLAGNLPQYERNIRNKVRSVQEQTAATSGGVLSRATDMFRNLRTEIERPNGQPPPPAGTAPGGTAAAPPPPPPPVPVVVQEPEAKPLEMVQRVLGPLAGPLATTGMVLVFTIFMLLQREDLRDRLIRLAGSGDLSRTTEAMNDAAGRVSRYLLMQVVVNVTYAIPIGIGLALLGVPNPLLWGMLATVLRFVPFLGPVIAASMPILLSFAVDSGWTLPLLTIALFVVVELFSNNVMEPWLYGSATGLSPVAIIVAAVFWTALWGPVGLLLSTPLTVCLVVLGRYVPRLRFLDVMFGDRPVLPDEAKVYQRLLARDPDEAAEVCEELLQERTVPELYGGVLLPALSLAEQDRQRGALDPERRTGVAEGFAELVDALSELGEPAGEAPQTTGSILCVGARNDLDEAAARLLADLLRRNGVEASVVSCDAVSPRVISSLGTGGVAAVVISYLNPSALPHARRMVRRLRMHFGPRVPVLIGLWSAHPEADAPDRATAETAADRVATNLSGAVLHLEELGIITARPEVAEAKAEADETLLRENEGHG
ncbi:AI-2E family transporter [Azospirillum sp.]|uniref:AI-2E family transporter n=1 Tax=Azospirillum sp. TaxID=34012 RepID=UPI002D3891A5|nr:AI-2E family transporter [Azospirillum sp.]HYD64881.1 AI-2E family transporter [Azospirillum sp.]